MYLLFKRIEAKLYFLIIILKSLLIKKQKESNYTSLDLIKDEYKKKQKIIVLANGPSALNVKKDEKYLYIVTNSGYRILRNQDFLYFINDGFYIKKVLAIGGLFLKKNQKIIFFYQQTKLHFEGFVFLKKYLKLLYPFKKFMISEIDNDLNSINNWDQFFNFYKERNLPIKIQNSGVFILLFGYYLSCELKIPIEIYGLDLGEGGLKHYDNKGIIGKSVTNDRVKKNVSIYLNYMENESNMFTNFSYFKVDKKIE